MKCIIGPINIVILISLLLFSGGCSKGETGKGDVHPGGTRIISLSPAITKQIIDLDAEDLLVGVTSYHPVLKRNIEVVGSLVSPNFEKILMLKPDIILISEEDRRVQNTERLAGMGVKTYGFKRNRDFQSICDNYLKLAEMIGKKSLGREKIAGYRKRLGNLRTEKKIARMALIVSHVPLMAASGSTYVSGIIGDAGGINIYGDLDNYFSIVSVESLVERDPDVIISMMKGAVPHFQKLLGNFKNLKVVKKGRIYAITPDHIAFYTPADYIRSVEIISELLKRK